MEKKELLVIYVTKDKKEIHRDRSPLYVPVETNLISFKNINTQNLFGYLKNNLCYVANVEFQVPDVIVVTLLYQDE